jgi:hypothetical protein
LKIICKGIYKKDGVASIDCRFIADNIVVCALTAMGSVGGGLNTHFDVVATELNG